MEYKEETEVGGNKIIVRFNDDGTNTFIPMDEANSDYQAYLNRDNPQQSTPNLTE
jgi:hypothetical protein